MANFIFEELINIDLIETVVIGCPLFSIIMVTGFMMKYFGQLFSH